MQGNPDAATRRKRKTGSGRRRGDRPLVLITGASGLLGTALIDALEPDYEIVGLDKTTGDADCEQIEVDLTSSDAIDEALATFEQRHGKRIAACIHLAAYYDFTGDEHPLYEKLNVNGTRLLLEKLQAFEIERFIYASTMLVHAPTEPGVPIDESSPLAPAWAYPKSKAAAEEAVREHRGRIPCTILRFAGVYSDTGGVPTLTDQIRRAYERTLKSRLFAGEASHGQSMVHIEDVCDAVRRTVDRRGSLPECSALLIGEPRPMSYEAQQNLITESLHGEHGTLVRVPKVVAKTGAWLEERSEPVVPDAIDQGEKPFIRPFMIERSSDHYELDVSAAKEQLGWEPRHELHRVLPKICAALERDPLRWYRDNGLTAPRWLEQLEDLDDDAVNELGERHEVGYRSAHARSRWAHFMNMGLGVWLMTSPMSHGYAQTAMVWSEVLAGAALLVCAALSLSWRLGAMRWVTAGVGLYLMMAPLVLWTPDAAAYLNGTLVGALVMGLAVALPPTPGVAPVAELERSNIPVGWSFSPSAWTQRVPIIALAFVGLVISRYLAAYQLEHIGGVWDPFFSSSSADQNGTEAIITSSVSEAWPVPDAGLGAMTYMLEIITGLIGSSRRWRTMPWLVMLFGIMIVPLGAVSIFFIVIQPIVIGTWCTLCLIAAAAMLIQIPYSLDELVATSQFLLRRKRAGRSLLRVFFVGDIDDASDDGKERDARADTDASSEHDERNERDGEDEAGQPRRRAEETEAAQASRGVSTDEFNRSALAVIADCFGGGVNVPWNLLVCMLIGVFLMCTRLVLGTEPPLAHADHLIGALVLTVTVTALAEVARPVRFLNLLLGAALMGAPWLFGAGLGLALILDTVLGLALILLSLPRGRITNTYGRVTPYLR